MLDNSLIYNTTTPNNKVTFSEQDQSKKDTSVKLLCVNDLHAQIGKMSSLITAADNFTKSVKDNPDADSFKVSSGDIFIGKNTNKNKLCEAVLDRMGVKYSAIGNHEMDDDENGFAESIKDGKVTYIATNIHIDKNSPLADAVKKGRIVKSVEVTGKNGDKYGILGAMPVDIAKHLAPEAKLKTLKVDDYETTVKDMQEEVDKLKKDGVDKIFVLSHLGLKTEKQLINDTSGISYIAGGHSHDIIDNVEVGRNVLKSKDGKPCLVTQAGKDGKHYGLVDLNFDKKGVLTSAKNKVCDTNKSPKNFNFMVLMDKYLGKADPIGIFSDISMPADTKNYENPFADLVADSIKEKSGAQIALVNGQSIRGDDWKDGIVTNRTLDEHISFQNPLYEVKMSEKDIVDTLNYGAKTTAIQVSGLQYTVGKDKKVKSISIENTDGSLTKLNTETPSSKKKFTAVYNEYLLKGKHNCNALKKTENDVIQKYDWIEKDATMEDVKNKNFDPIEMKAKGRITREDKVETGNEATG